MEEVLDPLFLMRLPLLRMVYMKHTPKLNLVAHISLRIVIQMKNLKNFMIINYIVKSLEQRFEPWNYGRQIQASLIMQ